MQRRHVEKGEPPWHPDEVDECWSIALKRPSDGLLATRGKGRSTRVNANATRSSTQVATDKKGEILSIDAGHRGPKADIRLYEESGVHQQFPNADKLGDKGYQSQAHSEIISPHKKPKGGELTPEQRQENRQIAQQRIYVEHGIRCIGGWRILREDYRLGVGLFPMIARAVVGLVQLGRMLG